MIDLMAKVETLNVFQLQELDRKVKMRLLAFGAITAPALPSVGRSSASRASFKCGDLVDFYSPRDRTNLRARVEKVNSVNLSVRVVDSGKKWRVAPALAHLVGADKPASPFGSVVSPPEFPAPRIPAGSMSSAAPTLGGGAW